MLTDRAFLLLLYHGRIIGYEHTFVHGFADFPAGLEGGEPFPPDIRSAMRTQQVRAPVLNRRQQSVG